jgi:uncharacterized protein YwqG
MDKAGFQAALTKVKLTRLIPYSDMLLQPAIRLYTTPISETKLAVGVSKIGGIPDLPSEVAWPLWKGLPQAFIAQFRLTDLHDSDPDHLLPQRGMLWFFYDAQQETYGTEPEDRGAWKVIYSADNKPLQRTTPPKQLPAASRFKASTITFVRQLTLAQQPQLEIPGLAWNNDDQEKYDEIYEQFYAEADKEQPRHQLLGFPYTLQDDMRLQCQMATHNITDIDNPKVEELSKNANDWRLLLQIDSDERINMNWASTGILYYWIKGDDLKAALFDHTWLVLQSE